MYSSDAAEQIVRMSLQGVEVAAKITGESAKTLAVLLAATLKEEHKTKGPARLTNMIKSGKELKVFSLQNKDIEKFAKEAKRYGVLYCVLKDKDNKSPSATVDVIARAEDAAKIQRIIERFDLTKADKATVISNVERDVQARKEQEKGNPTTARTDKSPLSEKNLQNPSLSAKEGSSSPDRKPSVREKLNEYKVQNRTFDEKEKVRNNQRNNQKAGKSKGKKKARAR